MGTKKDRQARLETRRNRRARRMERALSGLSPDWGPASDVADPKPHRRSRPGPLARTVTRMVGLVSRLAEAHGNTLIEVVMRIVNLPLYLLVPILRLEPFSGLRHLIQDGRFGLAAVACITAIPVALVSAGLLVLLALRLVGVFQPVSDLPYIQAGLASVLFWNFFALAVFGDYLLKE